MRLIFTDMAREAKDHISKCYDECCDILRKYGSMRICHYWSSLPDHKAKHDIMVYIPNFDGGLDLCRIERFDLREDGTILAIEPNGAIHEYERPFDLNYERYGIPEFEIYKIHAALLKTADAEDRA